MQKKAPYYADEIQFDVEENLSLQNKSLALNKNLLSLTQQLESDAYEQPLTPKFPDKKLQKSSVLSWSYFSKIIVTGPSLISCTSIIAPKRPVSTVNP